MADEIIKNLWIGDLDDLKSPDLSKEFDRVINVLGLIEPSKFGYVSIDILDALGIIIDKALNNGEKVLVHCGAGIERSPLVVAWYLWRHKVSTLDKAYKLITDKREIVQRRDTTWVQYNDLQYNEMRILRFTSSEKIIMCNLVERLSLPIRCRNCESEYDEQGYRYS